MTCLDNSIIKIKVRFLLPVISVLLLLVLAGCGTEEKKEWGKHHEYKSNGATVKSYVGSERLNIAENLSVRLLAEAPEGWNIEFAEVDDNAGDLVLALDPVQENIRNKDGDIIQITLELEYVPVMTGEMMLPEYEVKFSKGSESFAIRTQGQKVSVVPVISDISSAELKGIPDVIMLKKDYTLWYILGGGSVVILLAVVVWLVIKIVRRRIAYRALCRPFYTALKELERIEKSGKVESGEADYICVEASDIIRKYIAERFGIIAERCTTEEFLNRISDDSLLISNYRVMLKEFLQKCDVVKFARYAASKDECMKVIMSSRIFVFETKRDEIKYKGEYGSMADCVDNGDK